MYISKRFISYGHVKALQVGAAFFLVIVTLSLIRRLQSGPERPSIYEYTEGRTSEWRDWQHKNATTVMRAPEAMYFRYLVDAYGLTREVPWLARRVRPRFSGTGRPSVTKVGAKLMSAGSAFARVRMDDDEKLQEKLLLPRDTTPIKLTMPHSPKPEEADASAILFGVATSYRRVTYADKALLRDWQRWLTDGKGGSNGAALVLSLQRATNKELAEVRALLRGLGIDAEVLASHVEADAYGHYAELAQVLQKRSRGNGEQPTRSYIGLIEDDMFFPSMSKLLQMLRRYAPDKAYYIGAPSERSDWEVEDKAMVTYGGGAVFLTVPMLDKLTDLPCLARPDKEGDAWDRTMYHCVSRSTDTPLQVLPGFYSPHRDDDALYGGGYGSGLQATTLHHYRNYHRFEAAKGHLVASVCGESCFLQRFRFDDDWILVNGYTVTHYPEGVDSLPLRKKAGRFVVQQRRQQQQQQNNAPDTSATTRLSERLVLAPDKMPADLSVMAWRGRKKTWRLLDASVRENGELWQAYVNRRGAAGLGDEFDDRQLHDIAQSDEEASDVDSIIVLMWES